MNDDSSLPDAKEHQEAMQRLIHESKHLAEMSGQAMHDAEALHQKQSQQTQPEQ